VFSAGGRKLPPAPGCVDQQLTSLAVQGPALVHEELEIPAAPADTPYALQILLELFRTQYLQALDTMKSPAYRHDVQGHVDRERVSIHNEQTFVSSKGYFSTAPRISLPGTQPKAHESSGAARKAD